MQINRGQIQSILGFALLLTALCVRPTWTDAASDGVLDAKRKAAAQLLRDGKASDALALLTEVVAVDDKLYSDQLLMARACDKLAQPGREHLGLAYLRGASHVLYLLLHSRSVRHQRYCRQSPKN